MTTKKLTQNQVYIEAGIRRLFGPNFIRVEGNWYLLNKERMLRICYSKAFDRSGFKRYFFGVQQDKYNHYKSQDIHILFICGDFDSALLIPSSFLDELLKNVPVAADGSWKLDIHQREGRFDILVTGKSYQDISSYICNPIDKTIFEATSDSTLLDERVEHIRKHGKLKRPKGNTKPKIVFRPNTQMIERLPAVKAWVLQEAGGMCELCGQPGPFILPTGEKYLEVHHIKQLADGGPDSVENAVAVCPNCHRLLHWSVNAQDAKEKLYKQVTRLIRV